MSFCTKCGTEIKEEASFCANCGAPVNGENSQTKAESFGTSADGFNAAVNQFTETTDRTAEFEATDISNNKVYAVLSYIGFLVLVPLIAAPNSKFARFHANQGLVLLIGEVAYNIVRNVLLFVLSAVLFGPARILYTVVKAVTGILSLAFAVLSILGIINAAQGRAKDLPVVGKIHLLK